MARKQTKKNTPVKPTRARRSRSGSICRRTSISHFASRSRRGAERGCRRRRRWEDLRLRGSEVSPPGARQWRAPGRGPGGSVGAGHALDKGQ